MKEQDKYQQRASFRRGAQTKFIVSLEKTLDIGLSELASIAKVNRRTIYDWRREKFSMSLPALKKLCLRANIPIPRSIQVRDPFWYVSNGGKVGGIAVMKKYGRVPIDPEYRESQWRNWWEREGKFTPRQIYTPLPFKKPTRSSELAEFMGIMMGDGGMSNYQISVTLHHVDDEKYGQYVVRLMKKLFGVTPTIRHIPKISVNTYTVSRTEIVKYLHGLGLAIGNKIRQQIDIPNWIKSNRQYRLACIRGLIDTDGSVVIHKYFSGSKYYTYKKLDFTSRSVLLLRSVNGILTGLGIKNSMRKDNIRIEAQKDVKMYFDIVGSHNPKHIKRYGNGEVA
jgi:hypothetical protein